MRPNRTNDGKGRTRRPLKLRGHGLILVDEHGDVAPPAGVLLPHHPPLAAPPKIPTPKPRQKPIRTVKLKKEFALHEKIRATGGAHSPFPSFLLLLSLPFCSFSHSPLLFPPLFLLFSSPLPSSLFFSRLPIAAFKAVTNLTAASASPTSLAFLAIFPDRFHCRRR